MIRSAILIALAGMTLSGCMVVRDTRMITGSTAAVSESLAKEVSADYSVAYLPELAGSIMSVRQSTGANWLTQRIVYDNGTYIYGENHVSVDISKPNSSTRFIRAPTRRTILLELKNELANVPMRITEDIGDNLQGTYGYAIGHSKASGNCIYAWQLVDDLTPSDVNSLRRWTEPDFAATIRVRYCHPTMSKQALKAIVEGLRVKAFTKATFDLLRFAEGSAQNARARTVYTPPPVIEPQIKKPKRKTVRKTATPRPVAGVVEVPLPAEAYNKAAEIEGRPIKPLPKVAKISRNTSSNSIENAATVPLPGAISGAQ